MSLIEGRRARRRILVCLTALLVSSYGTSFSQEQESRVDIGGYGSFRLDADDADGGDPSFTMRRFVVTTDARVGSRLTVYSEIEYERFTNLEVERSAERSTGGLTFEQELEGANGSEIALEQAWGQFGFSEAFAVRFGAVLPPVGRFNIQHDDNLWNLPRRPLIDRAAAVLPAPAAWSEMGLGFVGSQYLGERARLSYQAFLLTGTSLDFAFEQKVQTRTPNRNKMALEVAVSPTPGAFDGSNAADAFAGRIEFSPVLGSLYGVSAYSGRYTPDFLDVKEYLTTFGLDGKQRLGSLEVEGEFLYSRYHGVDRVLSSFAEAALDQATETGRSETADLESEIEIEISGLATDRYGVWVDLSRPIPLAPGTFGLADAVLIPLVRYEHAWLGDNVDAVDFNDGVLTGLSKSDVEQSRISLGVAFRPVPEAVVQFVYSRDEAHAGTLIDPAVENDDVVNAVTLGLAVGF